MGIIIGVAPLGVLGAIAFTVGKYGAGSLKQLGMLVVLFYAAVIVFVVVVLAHHYGWPASPLQSCCCYLREGTGGEYSPPTSRQRAAADHEQKLKRMGIPRQHRPRDPPPATRSASVRSPDLHHAPR